MILNTGDVPNLYPPDEKAEIIEKMQVVARTQVSFFFSLSLLLRSTLHLSPLQGRKIDATPLSMYNFFIERVKEHLHVVLAMSPIGDSFRNRLRMFPSLINCCTIDWFQVNYNLCLWQISCRADDIDVLQAWPNDALEMVANKFLEDVDMTEEMRGLCVSLCQHFHQSVRTLSDRYFAILRRNNYVTPTSYLELILTFKTLLGRRRHAIHSMRQRYVVGLEKLEFAAGQVSVMQQELQELQPQLVQTSKETDELMVTIERDTVEAEAKKQVSHCGLLHAQAN